MESQRYLGGIDDFKRYRQQGATRIDFTNVPLLQVYPLPLGALLEFDAIFRSLCGSRGRVGSLCGRFCLFPDGVDPTERNKHASNRSQQIQAIKTILACIIEVCSFIFSLWLMRGGGNRSGTRLVLFYLCFALAILCALIVDGSTGNR